ncbi:MAG: ABC transporter ATP-binding protein [Chitinispirillaceae bacterium]|nr:ABC transporter ATP-binding protein [Chitinispirillaceae bacterium]
MHIVFSSRMISLTSVTKKFASCTAVDAVSCTIGKGECFALLGPNGAGKTTFVRMILGFVAPNSGSVTVNGRPPGDPEARRSIGYVPEQLTIPPFLSGKEYLLRHSRLCGISGLAARREMGRVLEIVSMTGHEAAKSAAYSKGMKQRIGLAGALLGNPQILILDEPVSGLDPIGIRDVRNIIDNLRNTGATVVINSHLLSEVEKTCTTAGIMHKGKVLVKDAIENIVGENDSLEDVFIRYVEQNNA